MIHGGDLLTYKDCYNGELVDFSSNINPLGIPKGLEEELVKAFKNLEHYPDIKYRSLKKSVGQYLNCHEENVVIGNGSMEIIDNIMNLKDRVCIFYPSFGEYEERAAIQNKKITKISLNENLEINLESLKNNLEWESVVIIGNPNNPTGLRVKKEKLLLLYNIVMSKNSILVLDEAFYEFCPEDYDSIELFKNYNFENVVIIRAATKFFALPGIRLGYGCCGKVLAQTLGKRQLPWSINTMAEVAGNYIFKQKEYIESSKQYVAIERAFLFEELNKIKEISAQESHANFILLKLSKYNGEYLLKKLLSYGILIRTCTSFLGLDDSFIRIAIKNRQNNKRIINALKEIYKGES